jgi:hypothetical protein
MRRIAWIAMIGSTSLTLTAHAAELPALDRLSVRATAVARIHCGACHLSNELTSKKDALAVFDLTQERWWARLRPAQFRGAIERLEQRTTMTQAEINALTPQGARPPRQPSLQEVQDFRDFIARALDR